MFKKSVRFIVVRSSLILAFLLAMLGAQPTVRVHAATLIVTNSGSSGTGSLSQTINNANPGDIITFDPSLAGVTITFYSKSLTKNITIDGTGLSSPVTLSGVSQLFQIASGITVEFKNLILTNGSYNGLGGAINNQGTLKITQSVISNSGATSFGGGIYNTGQLTVTATTFSNNHSTQASGGAIFNMGTTTITDSTFVGNYTNNNGGAILSYSALNITNSTFYQNAPSAIESSGQLTVKNSTISKSGGFGVITNGNYSTGSNTGTLKIENTILANNGSEDCYNNGAIILSFVNNLIKVGNCGTPLISSDPNLGSLMDNGGFTQTTALLPGSPAIDTGSGATCAATDQRGIVRSQRSGCDIGAYEYDYTGVYYVKPTASGSGNCQSWANACTLQAALTTAVSGDEIWVAAGTYKPTTGTDRTISFTLKNGVAVYGGFAGTESLLSERDYAKNVTTLSGDLGMDNSYHVVVGSNTDSSAILDGFTVTGGNANELNTGGGMFNHNGSPTIRNIIFSNNSAFLGGGMYNGGDSGSPIPYNGSNPILENVIFSGNSAIEGGGMENQFNSSPTLSNVVFNNNIAERSGGGLINMDHSAARLTNVTFDSNTAMAGGGMANFLSNSTLTNVTFRNNSAQYGGGIENVSSVPTATNATFTGNTATSYGGGISNEENSIPNLIHVTISGNAAPLGGGIYSDSYGSNVTTKNSIVYGNSGGEITNATGTSTVTYSIVQGGYTGTGNLNVDPKLSSVADNGGFTQTMALSPSSPAIDAADDGSCAETDQRGVVRPQGNHCDIGAYEYQDTIPPLVTSITRASANPTNLSSVNFTVTFSEPVFNVGANDFRLTTTGINGALVSNVTGTGNTYTVTVNTGADNGNLRLDVVDNDSIKDASNNPLGGVGVGNGSYTSGEVYKILKGADTAGVFRPSNGLLYLKNTNATGYADVAINYGQGGDYPVVGDWDGNGTVTIGIYRNGYFYLRNANTVGFADKVFAFGQPGDQPIAGDWNGDGIDTIEVYRSSTGTFYLCNSNSAGAPEMTFQLGIPGDVGIAGDWNGDGIDTTGVFRPSNGALYLKNTNATGYADIQINYGQGGDFPVVGDWDNDGIDTIGVYRNGQFLLRNSNTIGYAEMVFALGVSGDVPIAGNWDGLP